MVTLPMLVHQYDSKLVKAWPYLLLSEKYDGWRLVYNHLSKTFTTRTGKILPVPEYITSEMNKIYSDFAAEFNFDLDGEYWGGYGMFSKISEDNSDTGTSLGDQMYFKIYDIINTTMTFEQRHDILNDLRTKINQQSHIQIVDHIKINISNSCGGIENDNFDQIIRNKMNEIVSKGGEGIIVRNPYGKYLPGQRSYNILKLKPIEFTELIVMAHHVTESKLKIPNNQDYVSSLICYTEDGDDLRITWGNRKQKAPSVHSVIRIKYSQLTVAGIPKFPSYISTMAECNLDPAQLEKFNNLKLLNKENVKENDVTEEEKEEKKEKEEKSGKCIVLISSYYTTKYAITKSKSGECKNYKEEYVSTLLAYTIDCILTSIVVKSSCPPLIGQLLKISYNSLTKKGAPKNPRIIEIVKNEQLTANESEKFDELRALEGIAIKCSLTKNTYSLSDGQIKLLKNNNKFVTLCTLQEAIVKKIVIPPGKFVLVQNGANVYKVCCSVKGNNIYCSCPSWIYQPLPPIKRTCKHCQSFLLKNP